jgi:hypothetical protein
MKFNMFISLIVAIILSMVVSKIVYFGFTPNYANFVFSKLTFNRIFEHDVYQYRVLSKYLLFAIDNWLASDMPAQGAEPRILVGTPSGSERFYLAFYYLNAAFLVLTSIMVVLIVNLDRQVRLTVMEKNLIIFLVPILIGLSQFTVCCYDVSSYFFQLLIIYIFLRFADRHYWGTMLSIGALVILSTVNRESSALSVSMAAILLLTRYGLTRKTLIGVGALAACFLATYVALRIFIVDPQHIRIMNPEAGKLFIDTNMIGLLFWMLFFYLPFAIAEKTENRILIGLFFVLSLPYIITVFKDGVLWEVRLYIPLFLGALFLSKLNVSAHAFRVSRFFGRPTTPPLTGITTGQPGGM